MYVGKCTAGAAAHQWFSVATCGSGDTTAMGFVLLDNCQAHDMILYKRRGIWLISFTGSSIYNFTHQQHIYHVQLYPSRSCLQPQHLR